MIKGKLWLPFLFSFVEESRKDIAPPTAIYRAAADNDQLSLSSSAVQLVTLLS